MNSTKNQITERLLYACLLTITGGSLTSFSYMNLSGVFAGFQTGNIIKLGIHIGSGQWNDLAPFIVSIITFMLGIALTRTLRYLKFFQSNKVFRDIFVLAIALLLIIVSGIMTAQGFILLPIALLTLCVSSQYEEFRTIHGTPFTPMMMSGNLRKMTEDAFDYFIHPQIESKQKAKQDFIYISSVIISYFIGVLIMAIFQPFLTHRTIIICIIFNLISLGWLIINSKNIE
ncbi:YoaK family protein [Facklamia hominis]|uniref:DUF1275 domain-containing protein n=2 Tax=Facklamia hominis TaxID=178214 RepID=K1LJZ3_9LACT|nr:YoaK family protein [Facklamia hominis]EKB54946.1 hypothetical protein HMPREF9706_01136 [Facklamia hominis CCUG 36813]EPH08448.1 hypothetical protein HMPREF9260_01550 [Facklamia hominis ACS-120-V-Sch10]MDK7187755.1 YoaK family protein [Facklamia hominis]PKY93672.1 DUF1275 domain-containing protein [Facklamia hominis]WPJ90801.1 YoaK family protein [Facklamia hominis]